MSKLVLPLAKFAKLLRSLHQALYTRTVLILSILFFCGIAGALGNTFLLSSRLIESQAIQNASLYAQSVKEARTLYSNQVVNRLKTVPGIVVTHDYANKPGAVPLPATFLLELSQHLEERNSDISFRLYSDYPFPWRRATGGARDDFERQALQYLRQHPDQTFVRVEQVEGRRSLRYAEADRMKASCVKCHNTHPDSPKRDWKVGDVRGILEVIKPLDKLITQTNQGLQGMFVMLAVLSVVGLLGIALVMRTLRQTSRRLELRVRERTAELERINQRLQVEQEKSERLLLNVLPEAIAIRLKEGQRTIADGFSEATILFADIVNFTQMSENIAPSDLVAMLNEIFSGFDRLTEEYGLEKIKTIGDAYMVVGGLPQPHPEHMEAVIQMALAMRQVIERFNVQYNQSFSIRIGVNTGPVVAGVIGTKKFIYDIWGDTVNIASRMESHGLPGEIQVTEAIYTALRDKYTFEPRGTIEVKGKGAMSAYLLVGQTYTPQQPPEPILNV